MTKQETLAYMHEVTRLLVSATKEEHKDKVLEAHSIAIECIEKQIPRKPKAEKVDFDIRVGCPRCGREILYINVIDLEECERYCCNCGQALEIWSDNE